eukprot:TRINITY_DN1991_c0_g1_i3.p1 TRINITY_DN1991_c0_g1~~TRINITY_DN1991_c0_g1_i3.p1  ORF type:complete len:119 (-),score=7.82 TRINITY_DN1991_c0_g1_i3:138-494(-)
MSDTVTLVSAEGYEFILDRKCALVSKTISSMLDGAFLENEMRRINFREIPGPILEKVIQYFYYKVKYTNNTQVIPEFPIEPEIALELLMAANLYVFNYLSLLTWSVSTLSSLAQKKKI